MNAQNLKIDVVELNDNEDGSVTIKMDVNEDFMKWFIDYHDLQEFSQEKFEQWFQVVIDDYVNQRK